MTPVESPSKNNNQEENQCLCEEIFDIEIVTFVMSNEVVPIFCRFLVEKRVLSLLYTKFRDKIFYLYPGVISNIINMINEEVVRIVCGIENIEERIYFLRTRLCLLIQERFERELNRVVAERQN
jgi:hypothetical protein